MKVPDHVQHGELGFNMTPMIDVVFLLIIFFLVSSHLAKQEVQMDLPLPRADSGEAPQVRQTRRLTLNVLKSGELLLAGRRIERAQLQERLTTARADQEGIEVRIRSDRSVPYRNIEPLLLACARAGIWNVTFGVLRRDQ